MRQSSIWGLVAVFVSALFMATPSFATQNPVTELNSIADQLINRLKEHQTTLKDDPRMVYSLANEIVVPHADVAEMAKRVLPPNVWNGASGAQRGRFVKAFTTLLVHTYASALANYTDQTVHFYPVRGGYEGRSTVEVNSSIERPDGPAISVNYRLILAGSQWKLFDMTVEGISMLESFRSQFSEQLSQGNMDALINKLEEHNRD
jgi:phospholipid transport system substrate-binding protein